MHPMLMELGGYRVASYSFCVTMGVATAVVALAIRVRRTDLDHSLLALAAGVALVAGWVGGRVLPPLLAGRMDLLEWGMLLPTRRIDLSLSCFLAVASPAACAVLWRRRGQMLSYLDAVCPSLLAGLALAKVGCLLAGCCAGGDCSAAWGIRYPYGSEVYTRQWRAGRVSPPDALIRTDARGTPQLLGHAQLVTAHRTTPPVALIQHARQQGATWDQLAESVRAQRSLPVWPVPIWYSAAAAVLWLGSEWLYRRCTPGWTTGFTLATYSLLRVSMDGFLGSAPRAWGSLTQSQWMAVPVLAIGGAILLTRHAPFTSRRDDPHFG